VKGYTDLCISLVLSLASPSVDERNSLAASPLVTLCACDGIIQKDAVVLYLRDEGGGGLLVVWVFFL